MDKSKLYKFLSIPGLITPTALLRGITRQRLLLPFYHTVSDCQLPHISNIYRVKSVKEFEHDLDYLQKHFNPVGIEEIAESKSSKKNSFLLSFDDALKQFKHIVAPILVKRGIPAVIFVNPDFAEGKTMFYRHKVSLILERLKKSLNSNIHDELSGIVGLKPQENIAKSLLTLSYTDGYIIDRVAELLEIDFNDYLKNENPYLSSEELVSLKNQGFTIGAHSMDHPMYSDITPDQQLAQTIQSIQYICKVFQQDSCPFAFPFTDAGVKARFYERLESTLQGKFTYIFGGAGIKITPLDYLFERIPMEMSDLKASEIIKSEYLYYIGKAIFSKNKLRLS